MDRRAKIELIEILQKKLCVDDDKIAIETLDDEHLDLVLEQFKKRVIAVAKEKHETSEKRKHIKKYLKQWCKLHKLDYSVLGE